MSPEWRLRLSLILVISVVLVGVGATVYTINVPSSVPSSIHIDGDRELMEQAKRYGWSGTGTSDDPVTITGLRFNQTGGAPCAYLGNTTKHVVIGQCIFIHSFDEEVGLQGIGVKMFNVRNATIDDNDLISLSCGIEMRYCNDNLIRNNTMVNPIGPVVNRGTVGLVLDGSVGNEIAGNQMSGGGYFGIGMSADGSTLNSIRFNTFIGASGLYIGHSDQNDISNNTILSNRWAMITLKGSDLNTITGNVMSGPCYYYGHTGLTVMESDGNIISFNTITRSDGWGYLVFLNASSGNLISKNDLLGGQSTSSPPDPMWRLAFDDSDLNSWNDTATGNHWSDWTAPDDDGDGIVDLPYPIDGGAGASDQYPLVHPVP